jgi:L-ascorbate metabolism protein UlaG (beta-lactamase superfamily)
MKTQIIWHGHAGFSIKWKTNILIDPFFTGNPVAREEAEDISTDLIAVTHGHFDHAGDAVKISRKNGAPVLCAFELSEILKQEGAQTIDINLGGTVEFEGIRITAVPAVHSSSYNGLYAGEAMGYIIDNGKIRIYHAGDTSYFKDMELIGGIQNPDVAMLPIGGHYTMDIDGAVEAIKLIGAKKVIPMHYNTFPPIKADVSEFKRKAEDAGAEVFLPEIAKSFTL